MWGEGCRRGSHDARYVVTLITSLSRYRHKRKILMSAPPCASNYRHKGKHPSGPNCRKHAPALPLTPLLCRSKSVAQTLT